MLSELGLSSQSEAVYRAMLDDPTLNIAGLATRLSSEPAQIRAALDELADLALVRLEPTGEVVQAVRPGIGLTALLHKVERDIAFRQSQIAATREAITAIAAIHSTHGPVEETRRLAGLDAVRERLVELAHDARTECLSFTTGGAQAPDTISAEKPLNQLALERGVSMRNIYQESFRNDAATLAHARWMAGLGGQSRTAPTLPMRMVIVDRQIALVPVNPSSAGDGALEVRTQGLITALIALFEHIWESGTPFGEQPVRDTHGLNPQEQALLRLLADGHTDESAARRLATSVRSVQRMASQITEQLHATSRFQAGAEAIRRGWIT